MSFVARCFWHAKDLDQTRDYEDAFEASPESGRAAIADGVSSAIFSRRWSQILTAASVATPPDWDAPESLSTWIVEQRKAWSKAIDVHSLPWMQRMKLQESGGGYAAFLWVEVNALDAGEATEEGWRFRAIASGDCCLFHVRAGRLLGRFPLNCEADFDRDPVTWGSSTRNRDRTVPFQSLYGTCRDGDWLVLSSDALAKWLYRLSDVGQEIPWNTLWEQSAAEWTQRVAALRDLPADERIRVDDTTLVMLAIGAAATSESSPAVSVTAASRDALLLAAADHVVIAELVDEEPTPTAAVAEPAREAAVAEVAPPGEAEQPSAEANTTWSEQQTTEAVLTEETSPEASSPEVASPESPPPEAPPVETDHDALALDSLTLDVASPDVAASLESSSLESEPLELPSLSPLETEPKPSGQSSSSSAEEG